MLFLVFYAFTRYKNFLGVNNEITPCSTNVENMVRS